MLTPKRPLIIIGCGGHGRVIEDIARSSGDLVAGFLDDNPNSVSSTLRVTGPILGEVPRLIASHRFVVGIGGMHTRRSIAESILAAGGELAILVHPKAVIASDVTIGVGTVVMAGAIINTGTTLGRFVVVNTGAIIDHDNILEDNVHISPGCNLAGTVTCRKDSFIGTGASIIPQMVIGEGAYVAAGATVIRPVTPRTLVAGCPAVVKRAL